MLLNSNEAEKIFGKDSSWYERPRILYILIETSKVPIFTLPASPHFQQRSVT